MTKREFMIALVEKTALPPAAIIEAAPSIWWIIIDALKQGDTVEIPGLGEFRMRGRRETRQGDRVIPATTWPAFKADSEAVSRLNAPRGEGATKTR